MIWLYTGTPGSGKSLDLARDIYNKLNAKNKKGVIRSRVIANFEINREMVSPGSRSKFYYFDDFYLESPRYLIQFAKKFHKRGVEAQTLLIIDECQLIFNCRSGFSSKDKSRMEWIKFFTLHRKMGFNIILVAHMDKMIDRQIRALVETEVKHRKMNNFKFGAFFPFPLFVAVEYWYGVREKVSHRFFTYREKYGNFYDSFKIFEGGKE